MRTYEFTPTSERMRPTCVRAPLAELVVAELREKLEVPNLSFSFDRLFASDLSGRARAFQSLVNGGMEVSKAAALAGIMEPED